MDETRTTPGIYTIFQQWKSLPQHCCCFTWSTRTFTHITIPISILASPFLPFPLSSPSSKARRLYGKSGQIPPGDFGPFLCATRSTSISPHLYVSSPNTVCWDSASVDLSLSPKNRRIKYLESETRRRMTRKKIRVCIYIIIYNKKRYEKRFL